MSVSVCPLSALPTSGVAPVPESVGHGVREHLQPPGHQPRSLAEATPGHQVRSRKVTVLLLLVFGVTDRVWSKGT